MIAWEKGERRLLLLETSKGERENEQGEDEEEG